MAVFKVETKNQTHVDKKPRVYFTCHPDDFEKYFGKVCEDIFKMHDCAIYYTENMNDIIADDEKEVDLGRNNLFVVPVTYKLLNTHNRAMDEDIPYAFKESIPVLPVIMEPGIDGIYSQPDKFGELQYLNPYSTDMTEIPYEEKLKKYLDSVLISDEMAKRVRAAFDAYIFLSYRKKDRKYANELMKIIHGNPECRDIAIWFDEFLTPGESFKETIEKMLDDCKLFTLLITPNLLEKVVGADGVETDNYVISTELPLARKNEKEKGTNIFAVEMKNTDKENLSAINIEKYVNYKDATFREQLLESISKIAVIENNTPEHNFLIGIAYLEGIDMEVDRKRGIELITNAAEGGLSEAMLKLFDVYMNSSDYIMAEKWGERIVEYDTQHYGEESPITLMSLSNLAFVYSNRGNYTKALQINEKTYSVRCKTMGEAHTETILTLNNIAYNYYKLKDYTKALELHEKVYEINLRECGAEHENTLTALNNLGLVYLDLKEYTKALDIFDEVLRTSCKLLGEMHPNTLVTRLNVASVLGKMGDNAQAVEMCEKIYEAQCEIRGDGHPDTLATLESLMVCNRELGRHDKALESGEKLYDLRRMNLGADHPHTIDILKFMVLESELQNDTKRCAKFREFYYEYKCEELGKFHPDILELLKDLLYDYMDLRDGRNIALTRERIYEIKCETLGEEDFSSRNELMKLINDYNQINEYEKALQYYERAYDIENRLGEEISTSLLKGMAFCHKMLGNYDRSLCLYRELHECLLRLTDKDAPYVGEVAESISELTKLLGEE